MPRIRHRSASKQNWTRNQGRPANSVAPTGKFRLGEPEADTSRHNSQDRLKASDATWRQGVSRAAHLPACCAAWIPESFVNRSRFLHGKGEGSIRRSEPAHPEPHISGTPGVRVRWCRTDPLADQSSSGCHSRGKGAYEKRRADQPCLCCNLVTRTWLSRDSRDWQVALLNSHKAKWKREL